MSTPTKEQVSAEQVQRLLELLGYPYALVEPMPPPYPDVRITTRSRRIAVETTEVHWVIGPKGGSPARQREEQATRAGVLSGFWVQPNPIPAVVERITSKCGKSYRLHDDEELWLVLLGASSAAPASTFIFTPFLNLPLL